MLAWTRNTDSDTYATGQAPGALWEMKLPKPGWGKIVILSLCIGFSILSAVSWSHTFRSMYGGTNRPDFGEIYYGARCAIHHQDPYNPGAALKIFRAEGGTFPAIQQWAAEIVITIQVNLPTTLFLAIPLALFSYSTAQALWILLTAVLLAMAGYLIWTLGDTIGPALSGCFICIILANCQQLVTVGNVAGIAVSLCVVATCCFLKNRNVPLAVVMFALSLAIKPHDVGFVWLYFLLAGGVMRKRALQTLAVTCVIGITAAIWIAPISPHWVNELHNNHVAVSQVGGTSDPSPAGISSGNPGAILDLQAVLSVFLSDPHSFNLASYLIVGSLIAAWTWIVVRRRMTADRAWLALAVIAVLSLLPVYHRPYDAKLLMLALPACIQLWNEGGVKRWLSFTLTAAGVLLTSDLFVAFLVYVSRKPSNVTSYPGEKVTSLFLIPPLVLLAMGCFYLWVFISDKSAQPECIESNSTNEQMALSAAS